MKNFVIVIIAFITIFALSKYGTLSPCGMLRESVRQHDNVAAVLPDSWVDALIEGQYGALSPSRCLSFLVNNNNQTPPVTAQKTQQSQIQQLSTQAQEENKARIAKAWKETVEASNECRAKRLSGELKTYVEAAKCSNPRIIGAFSNAHYRYMDLIALLTTERLELAEREDKKELTEIQAQREGIKFFTDIITTEQQRNNATR